MIQVRRSEDRGRTQIGWLDSRHTFSFGDYYDPDHVAFRSLRVINDDVVEPGQGFGTHPHRDMEIVTVVLEGALEHKDSLGTGSVLRAGDVQRITAGTGVLHSEFNPSATERVHFYQIWILPERKGLRPGYEERRAADLPERGGLRLLAARDGRDGAATVNQDVKLYTARVGPDRPVKYPLPRGRHAWVQVVSGAVALNGRPLAAGDGAAVSDEPGLELTTDAPAEVLFFDLA
jgi:redox-sensitive bicupin YhaK (pirin superfamily)